MAIASGLTCVDYLATKYHPQNYNTEDLRYSPTFNVDDILSTIISRQNSTTTETLSCNNRYHFSSNAPPVLEFTNLSLVENDLEFTLTTRNDGGKNSDSGEDRKKSEFAVACGKMSSEVDVQKGKCFPERKPYEMDNMLNNGASKFKQTSCQPYNIYRNNSYDLNSCTSYESDEAGEELGSIFSGVKPFHISRTELEFEQECSSGTRAKESSRLHTFLPRLHDDFDDCESSDSELELSQIIPAEFSPSKSNARKRSSAEILHNTDTRFKRPCIDAEKMHRSIRRKELFVPISKF